MVFKGREQRHPDLGREVLMRFYADLEELAKMEREPLQEARNRMAMVLANLRSVESIQSKTRRPLTTQTLFVFLRCAI